MIQMFDSAKSRIKHSVRVLISLWENLRQRDANILEIGRIAKSGRELPAGLSLVSRVKGAKPKATLRFAQSDETFRNGAWERTPRNRYEAEFEGDWVLAAQHVFVASHGEVRLEDGRFLHFPHLDIQKPLGDIPQQTIGVVDEPVWVIQNWTEAFGHWLLHVMPRIHLARQLDPKRRIMTSHPGWDPSGLLALEGLKTADVLWFPKDNEPDGYLRVSDAKFVSHAVPRGNVHVYPLFTHRFDPIISDYQAKANKKSPVGKRIYVSRQTKAATQNRDGCQNRTELEGFFAERGFEVVYPERYPIPEQIAMFRDAEFIVAEGGSAPHLALFSRPGTKLIYISAELATINKNWQRRIADYKGLNYRHIIPTKEKSQRKYTANMEQVRTAFESLPWQ